jgi:hypothetical protein
MLTLLSIAALGWVAPRVSDLSRDEHILLFPTCGRQVAPDEAWEIRVHAWVFEVEVGPGLITLAADLAGVDLNDTGPAGRERLGDRLAPFLADNEGGKRVVIRLGNATFDIGRTHPGGHVEGRIRLSRQAITTLRRTGELRDNVLRYAVVFPEGDPRTATGTVFLLPETGLSVVSDIDDTIKISDVADRKALIFNTFVEAYRPVPGMAEVYRRWATERDAAFHYVSASPWQIFEPLHEFQIAEAFPNGTFHLRTLRMRPRSAINVLGSPTAYKLETIGAILADFPQRRFVLVGDSGERDPEIYGELARGHRERIVRILIRRTPGGDDSPARFDDAFRGLPREMWRVFDDAEEIRDALP